MLLLAFVSVVTFALLRVLPGDPVLSKLGAATTSDTAETARLMRAELGLDQPLVVQFVEWLGGALQGDFGVSYVSQYPVSELIGQRLPATLELGVAALLIAILVAVPAALLGAIRPGSWADRIGSGFVTASMAVPQFWLGILFVVAFAVYLGWFPARGYVALSEDPVGNLSHLLMPAVTLGISLAGPLMRFLRSSLAEVARNLYMRTAEGKGLTRGRAIVRHALPNALMSTLTFLGLMTGQLLGGVVLIEYIFGWPGLGSLTVSAVNARDYGVLQGVVLLLSALFVAVNLLVDLAYGFLNPQIRVEGR